MLSRCKAAVEAAAAAAAASAGAGAGAPSVGDASDSAEAAGSDTAAALAAAAPPLDLAGSVADTRPFAGVTADTLFFFFEAGVTEHAAPAGRFPDASPACFASRSTSMSVRSASGLFCTSGSSLPMVGAVGSSATAPLPARGSKQATQSSTSTGTGTVVAAAAAPPSSGKKTLL